MKYKNRILILSLLIITCIVCLLIFYPINKKNNNINLLCSDEIRGGFDIGSGATKIQIAKVKSCNNGDIFLEKVYYKNNKPVKYSQDLAEHKNQYFSQNIIQEGVKAMAALKEEGLQKLKEQCGNDCKVDVWRGIMTEAFRKAENWDEARQQLSQAVDGILIKRLNQKEEALYGFYPITKLKDFDKNQYVVWDMGGGSTQITAFDSTFTRNNFNNNGAKVIETDLGSSSFCNFLTNIIYSNERDSAKKLNPINHYDYLEQYSKKYIQNKIDYSIQKDTEMTNDFNKLYNNKKYIVIGGLLSISLPEVMKAIDPEYNRNDYATIKNISDVRPIKKDELKTIYSKLKQMSDIELQSFAQKIGMNTHYSKVTASNLLLVLNYMESSLNIDNIIPISTDGTDSILLSHEVNNDTYWRHDTLL